MALGVFHLREVGDVGVGVKVAGLREPGMYGLVSFVEDGALHLLVANRTGWVIEAAGPGVNVHADRRADRPPRRHWRQRRAG
jgi:hypothetical protein